MAANKDFSQVAHDVVMRATGQPPVEQRDITRTALDVAKRSTAPSPSKKPDSGRRESVKKPALKRPNR